MTSFRFAPTPSANPLGTRGRPSDWENVERWSVGVGLALLAFVAMLLRHDPRVDDQNWWRWFVLVLLVGAATTVLVERWMPLGGRIAGAMVVLTLLVLPVVIGGGGRLLAGGASNQHLALAGLYAVAAGVLTGRHVLAIMTAIAAAAAWVVLSDGADPRVCDVAPSRCSVPLASDARWVLLTMILGTLVAMHVNRSSGGAHTWLLALLAAAGLPALFGLDGLHDALALQRVTGLLGIFGAWGLILWPQAFTTWVSNEVIRADRGIQDRTTYMVVAVAASSLVSIALLISVLDVDGGLGALGQLGQGPSVGGNRATGAAFVCVVVAGVLASSPHQRLSLPRRRLVMAATAVVGLTVWAMLVGL